MSIESEITRITDNVASAYSEAEALGADVPAEANSDNLPGTLATIPRATIVQTTGSGTNNVMSQAAVTEELNVLLGDATSATGSEATIYGARKYAHDLNEESKKHSVFYIEGNSTTAGTWTGTCEDITEYYPGLMVSYKTNVAGVSGGSTLNINGLGAVAVVRNTTSAITTHYGVGSILMLTYTVDSSGTAYWKLVDYDSDTKTRSSNNANKKMYIIGATTQSTSGQTTYSNKNCYIGTDNCLYSGGNKVAVEKYGSSAVSVVKYGAVGDGSTDDTTAFQNALAENRVVYVPGGTYKISGTLVIRENCCLELSQDTVIHFAQTSGNCVEMRGSAALRGNHAIITVPYAFTGNVISLDTLLDGTNHATSIPPYGKSSPMFKRQRFIYDINILKSMGDYGTIGFCTSADGTCNGTGIYISATNLAPDSSGNNVDIPWMWAITMSGVRIAGGFSYGIHAINYDSPEGSTGHYEDDAWNHDMRIEAVVQSCEIGVALENCNGAHLAVTIQPGVGQNNSAKYAKHGFYLSDSKFVDMIGCRVWDWNASGTLWTSGGQYQHLALMGNCRGLLLDDFLVHEHGADIRSLIYTDTQSNFDSITILQEPTNKWFKSVDNKPYFYDGASNKQLRLMSDKIAGNDTHFIQAADGEYISVPNFTDVKAPYQDLIWNNQNVLGASNKALYIEPRAFTTSQVVRIRGLDWSNAGRIHAYKKSDNSYQGVYNITSIIAGGSSSAGFGGGIGNFSWDASTYTLTVTFDAQWSATSLNSYYLAFNANKATGYTANDVIMTINEEIVYNSVWQGEPTRLDESIYAQNLMLTSPNGTNYKLTISDTGVISATPIDG